MLQADLLPVTTTLGKLVRGLGQGEEWHCRRADMWRPAADVGGVALPGVCDEAARPGVTRACTHRDHHLSVTTSEEQLTAWWYLISVVGHSQHQKRDRESSIGQLHPSQYNTYATFSNDANPSKHTCQCMPGKSTAAGEESDLCSELIGQVGQSRAWCHVDRGASLGALRGGAHGA